MAIVFITVLFVSGFRAFLTSFLGTAAFHRFAYQIPVFEAVGIRAVVLLNGFIAGIQKQGTADDVVGSRAIAAKHDVFDTGQAGQCFDIGIVRLQSHGVGKEETIIHFALHDAGAHLLIAAQRAGFQNGNIPVDIGVFSAEGFLYQLAGGAGAIKFMSDQAFRVPYGPFDRGLVSYRRGQQVRFF